jgi:hypothetical protein
MAEPTLPPEPENRVLGTLDDHSRRFDEVIDRLARVERELLATRRDITNLGRDVGAARQPRPSRRAHRAPPGAHRRIGMSKLREREQRRTRDPLPERLMKYLPILPKAARSRDE